MGVLEIDDIEIFWRPFLEKIDFLCFQYYNNVIILLVTQLKFIDFCNFLYRKVAICSRP